MRNVNIDIEEIGSDRVGNKLCMFGKIKWEEDETTTMNVRFDNFPCSLLFETLALLEKMSFNKSDLIELPGIYIIYDGFTNKESFNKAMRNIFAIAVANIHREFVDIDVTIKEDWEEA